jgi:glycosyltransferase involved in cell wall biosynthesis
MKYSVVIPTYNRCDDLLKPCLESIFKYTDMADVELIISANGCTDNTKQYLASLHQRFIDLGFGNHFKVVWCDEPLGYAKATNVGVKVSSGEKIILLNNDTVLLEQEKNLWINLLNNSFIFDKSCGISGPIKQTSVEAGHEFCVFFCVMIDRKVFDKIGLLNEEYGVGTGEDIEFCIEAERAGFTVKQCTEKTLANSSFYSGYFPIYHAGEATMKDESLVKDFLSIYNKNNMKLARKYNLDYYKHMLMNNFERYMAIKGEEVWPREKGRYQWASSKTVGASILEIGCSNGYGSQFFGDNIDYLGLDYDEAIIEVANEEGWGHNKKFVHADINTFDLGQYDTIVAMEVIEHLDNGLEVVEKLKNHCKRLLITVPHMETPGFWGEHHRLHMLNETHFSDDFKFTFMGQNGEISDRPHEGMNLMMGEWNAK